MASAVTCEFLQERIDATKAAIIAHEAAITALSSGAESYTLDTGQTRQTVSKAQLGSVRIALNSLYNLLATLDARLNGGGIIVQPGS